MNTSWLTNPLCRQDLAYQAHQKNFLFHIDLPPDDCRLLLVLAFLIAVQHLDWVLYVQIQLLGCCLVGRKIEQFPRAQLRDRWSALQLPYRGDNKAGVMGKPPALFVATPNTASPVSSAVTSPTNPRSRSPSPHSPVPQQSFGNPPGAGLRNGSEPVNEPFTSTDPTSPTLTSLPHIPSPPKNSSRHIRDQSRSFFSNLKAAKSSNKVHNLEPTIRQVSQDTTRSLTESNESTLYSLRKSPGSTPDLSKSTFGNNLTDGSDGKP